MDLGLWGKVAIVTGGSDDIRKAAARRWTWVVMRFGW